jgi:hypothetical protein
MPAKKRSYSKKRRRVTKRSAPKRRKRTVRSAPKIDKFAMDLTQFMCPHDKSPAIRIPDSSLSDSLKMILETSDVFTPNDNTANDGLRDGAGAMVFFPGHLRGVKYEYTVSDTGNYQLSTLVTGGAQDSQSYQSINDSCESFRVVSATLKIQFIGESDENGGEIVVKKFDPDDDSYSPANGSDSGVPSAINQRCKKTEFIPAKQGAFVTINMSQAHRTETFENINFQNTRSMEGVVVMFAGCSATVPQSWRWTLIQNVELIPKKNQLIHDMSIPPPPPMPVFEHAYNLLMKKVVQANLDIVPARAEHTVRSAIYELAKSAVKEACSQGGYGIPKFIEVL